MVERRLRRRRFQVASPGIRTPCQTRTPELFFPSGEKPWIDADHPGAYDMARHLCARCGSRQWCLASALAHPENYGMWGVTTPAERARILVDLQATTARPERGSPGGSHLDRVTEPGKGARGIVTDLPQAARQPPAPDPGTLYRTARPERITSNQQAETNKLLAPKRPAEKRDDLRPPRPAPPTAVEQAVGPPRPALPQLQSARPLPHAAPKSKT
jgi:WhiB family transcriptional regulator, redox-sensing transcriptional regulator